MEPIISFEQHFLQIPKNMWERSNELSARTSKRKSVAERWEIGEKFNFRELTILVWILLSILGIFENERLQYNIVSVTNWHVEFTWFSCFMSSINRDFNYGSPITKISKSPITLLLSFQQFQNLCRDNIGEVNSHVRQFGCRKA